MYQQVSEIIVQLNYIILLGKYFIYNKKKKLLPLETYEFLLECKNSLKIKQEIMNASGKLKKFQKEWSELNDNL
jgi:hypothetical protein